LTPARDIGSNALSWIMGCVMIYQFAVWIGKLIFQEWLTGACSAGRGSCVRSHDLLNLSRKGWQSFSGSTHDCSKG